MKLQCIRPRLLPEPAKRLGWAPNEQRGNSSARGYGASWVRLRRVILERDCGLCVPCRSAGRITPAEQVDHIVNKAAGGTDAPENLQAICDPCHKAKTARESRGGT